MSEETIHDIKELLLVSPSKSLRRLSQETNLPYSTCGRAAKKAELRAYRVLCVQELLPMDHEKRVRFCLWVKDFLTQYPGILDVTFFYRRNMVSSERIRKLSKHVYMGSRKPSLCMKSLCILKGRVYKNTPRTIELKDAIRQEIQAVKVDTLGKVFQNLEKRIQVCFDVKGDQFHHRL